MRWLVRRPTTRKADGALLRSDIRFGKLRFVIDFEK